MGGTLYNNLLSVVREYNLDVDTLSLFHRTHGGVYDYSPEGYSYLLYLVIDDNEYRVKINHYYSNLSRVPVFELSIHHGHQQCMRSVIFEPKLLVKNIEYVLKTRLSF